MTLIEPHVSRYNQMLVVSVCVHCMILAGLMFLPKYSVKHEVVRPAFRVQLMELPATQPVEAVASKQVEVTARKEELAPKVAPPVAKKKKAAKVAKKVAVTKPEKVVKPAPVKKTPPPVATRKKTTPAQPVKPETQKPKPAPVMRTPPTPSKNLFQELDQVAALPKQKVNPAPLKKPETFLEEQVRELEALKARPVPENVTPIPVKPLETVPVKPLAKVVPPVANEAQKKFDELITAVPTKTPSAPKPVEPRSNPALIEDLEGISRLQPNAPGIKATAPMPKTASAPPGVGVQEIESLKQELASLQKGNIQVNTRVAENRGQESKPAFKSQIHSLSAPDPTRSYVKATVPNTMGATNTGKLGGDPDASVLMAYVAEVERLVMANWKSPVGAEHNQVRASFVIYPAGKIELPKLVQSSGNEVLDNLALRAISASEPFPPFPRELKEPNLHIVVHFRYVYQE